MSPATVDTDILVDLHLPLILCRTCGATGFGFTFKARATDEYTEQSRYGATYISRKFILEDPMCPCTQEVWVRVSK